MPAAAEPITVRLVLTIEPGIAESDIAPLFGPLQPGDTLDAAITFDPDQADLSPDPSNGTFKTVSGSIGPISLPFGELWTSTGPPGTSINFGGTAGGQAGGARVWFGFIWDRPNLYGDSLPRSANEIASYGPGRFTFDIVNESDASELGGTVRAVSQTPEPASLLLLGSGASLLAGRRRRSS